MIDQQLAIQATNVSALARELGLNRNTLLRHRACHIPGFLPAFSAEADAPGERSRHAELQRLYQLALDALATAQAGTLVQIGKPNKTTGERTFERIVSPTSIVRAIEAARKILREISALAAAPRTNTAADNDSQLGAGLERALARFEERMASAPAMSQLDPPLDAEVIEDEHSFGGTDVRFSSDLVELPPGSAATPGPEAGSGGVDALRMVGDPNPDEPSKISWNPAGNIQRTADVALVDPDAQRRAAELFLAGLPPDIRSHITDVLAQHAANDQLNPERIERPWPGNPAASLEERRAAGWPTPAPLLPAPVAATAASPSSEAQVDPGLPPRSRRREGPAPADPSRRTKRSPSKT